MGVGLQLWQGEYQQGQQHQRMWSVAEQSGLGTCGGGSSSEAALLEHSHSTQWQKDNGSGSWRAVQLLGQRHGMVQGVLAGSSCSTVRLLAWELPHCEMPEAAMAVRG